MANAQTYQPGRRTSVRSLRGDVASLDDLLGQVVLGGDEDALAGAIDACDRIIEQTNGVRSVLTSMEQWGEVDPDRLVE